MGRLFSPSRAEPAVVATVGRYGVLDRAGPSRARHAVPAVGDTADPI